MTTIKRKAERFAVYKNGVQQQHGFMTVEDALHAIWCDNGKNPEHFYRVNDDMEVYLEVSSE